MPGDIFLHTEYVDAERDGPVEYWDYDDDRQIAFDNCLRKHRLVYAVDFDTGRATLISVDGRKLDPSD